MSVSTLAPIAKGGRYFTLLEQAYILPDQSEILPYKKEIITD